MKKSFFVVVLLMTLSYSSVFGKDTACSNFFEKLSELPHTKLALNKNGFSSLWDGKKMSGCEIIYESDESIVAGKKVYSVFQSFIHAKGWVINNKLAADGPGSSTVGIESDKNKCCIHWSQHAWIEEETIGPQKSNHIEMIIQCSPK